MSKMWSILEVDIEWICTRDGIEKAKTMYRIIATITNSTGSMSTVIFDGVGTQLLAMTCNDLAATEDPMKKLYSVMEKEAFMIIQLLSDKKNVHIKMICCQQSSALCQLGQKCSQWSYAIC